MSQNKDSDENPYLSPSADTSNPKVLSDYSIHDLPRFSVWGVLGLSFITLGIYLVYWMWDRSKILNQTDIHGKISTGFMITAVALFAVNMLLGMAEGVAIAMSLDQNTIMLTNRVSSVINLASGAMNLVWIFSMRRSVSELGKIQKGDPCWPHGFPLFFFQVFYLQYKINQTIDRSV